MKICAYVLAEHAKLTYKDESYNKRLYAGMAIVIDILRRAGYEVDFAGSATVYRYDIVLVSITSDCDWWPFIAERVKWQRGNYKVIVGGQGVLNVRPFLQWVDYFVLGRAEGVIDKLVAGLGGASGDLGPSVVDSMAFSPDGKYKINQVSGRYPHKITLENGEKYEEDIIGCNHRCLFCGYTWHRKNVCQDIFAYSGLWNGGVDRERAIIDIANGEEVDFVKLRTTAIDGFSQRLRFMANKKITRDMFQDFLRRFATCDKPHQLKLYNIIGYPTETEDDWWELVDDIGSVDGSLAKSVKQTCILLHSTPFRAMPATPMACEPMSYRNYRKEVSRILGRGYKGNIFYQGNAIWAVESMGTESLPTVIQSAIVWRGTENDADNIAKIALSRKFRQANMAVKQVTLERYFDVGKLFGPFTARDLPTRYLRTYAQVERMWRDG